VAVLGPTKGGVFYVSPSSFQSTPQSEISHGSFVSRMSRLSIGDPFLLVGFKYRYVERKNWPTNLQNR
jgi:hypothetical protein